MSNLYLIGFMGTGKTTVGKYVAELLEMNFVDMDEMVVESEGCSINEIFKNKGEPYFREIESKILESISGSESLVVSTGGGCIESEFNRNLMKESGDVVFIDTPWDEILERLVLSSDRPLASADDGWQQTHNLYKKRLPLYLSADFVINAAGRGPEDIAREITSLVV